MCKKALSTCAAKAEDKGSLDNIKRGFMEGLVTKEEYERTLRAYQKRQDEMKSGHWEKIMIEQGNVRV